MEMIRMDELLGSILNEIYKAKLKVDNVNYVNQLRME